MPPKTRAARAAADEAAGADVVFELDDVKYTVKREVLESLDFREAIQEGYDTKIFKVVLGPAQWASFRAASAKSGRANAIEALDRLGDAFRAAAGTGNS